MRNKLKVRNKKLRVWTWLIGLVLLSVLRVQGQQIFPIQSTVQLVPPYSVYLPDYAVNGNDKLRVILINKDLTQPTYQVRLYISVVLNGRVIIRTLRSYSPPPIMLQAGVPTIISGGELSPYLDSRNLDFVGYSREQYEKTKTLPEGAFQICATAYDYSRQEIQISNQGCSFYYLAKNEPPLINLPACGSKIPQKDPLQIIFSWLPRNTSSPNSAMNTTYEFNLYEIRIAGRNPNDVVLNTAPVYTTTTSYNQLVYGPSEPLLIENMQYVWRVQAKDNEGKDLFRNNGFSEICTFTYGGANQNFQVGIVKDLKAEAQTEKKARISWTPQPATFDNYKVYYKKTSGSQDWFQQETKDGEIKIYDLEPETEYETRIQGKKNGYYGGYSEIVKFTTPKKKIYQCGDSLKLPQLAQGKPATILTKGMTLHARGMDIILTNIESLGYGWYKGKGLMSVDFLAGASFTASFDRVYIDEDRNVVSGKIILPSKGIDKMAGEQLESQEDRKLKRRQQENRDKYEKDGVVFYEDIFQYNDIAIAQVTVQTNGDVIITDDQGKQYVNTKIAEVRAKDPDKAVIIQDKNGDQVVIKKDGTVEKVSGGGLTGGGTGLPVSQEALDIVKKALKELRKEYDDNKLIALRKELDDKKKTLADYIQQVESEIGVTETSGTDASSTSSNIFIIDEEVVEDSKMEPEHLTKGRAHKQAERALNKAVIIQLFSKESNSKEEYELIAGSLTIKDKKAAEYLTEQKAAGTTESQLIGEVKQSILELVDKLMDRSTN